MHPTPADGREGQCHVVGTGAIRRLMLPLFMEIPGLSHAFTARGSDPVRAIAAAAGRSLPVFALRQVHGRAVHAIEERDSPPPPGQSPKADALITRRRGVGLQVSVADCVPALICDPVRGWLGAVHAGWRGTVAGALKATIHALIGRGARSADLLVPLGPSIGRCCFEVGEEVVAAFRDSDPAGGTSIVDGRPARVDLIAANHRQAVQEGVPEDRIATSGLCTACRPDLLESHRRSNGAPGRTAAFIDWSD